MFIVIGIFRYPLHPSVCVHVSDLPAEMMEKYAAAAGNHSKKSWPHKPTPVFDAMLWWVTTISFSNSTTDSSNLHSSRKRFQLLKEFLLADEMHPSCTKSVSAVTSKLVPPFQVAVLGVACRWKVLLKRNLVLNLWKPIGTLCTECDMFAHANKNIASCFSQEKSHQAWWCLSWDLSDGFGDSIRIYWSWQAPSKSLFDL